MANTGNNNNNTSNLSNGMLIIPPTLAQRFTNFNELSAVVRDLESKMTQVNDLNTKAVGDPGDPVAASYLSQATKPLADLTSLFGAIAGMFHVTGTNGVDAAGLLNKTAAATADLAAKPWSGSPR